MAQKVMYPGMVNSPETTITNGISESDTIIYVLDPARVPTPPNLMTLGTGTNAETVKVTEINDSAITVERGFQGIAKSWPAGTVIARNFTEYDYGALKENIEDLEANKETPAGAQAKADEAAGAVQAELDAHKSDYADLKTDYEKEATKFTIESDDTYDRETRPTVCYKKNGWVKLIYSITRIDGELMLRNEYLLRLPVGFRPKTAFVTLAAQCDLGITPPFEKMTLRVYDTGQLQVQEDATKKIVHGEVVFYAGGGTV